MNSVAELAPNHQALLALTACALLLLLCGGLFARSLRNAQWLGVLGCAVAALPAAHATGSDALAILLPCALAAVAILLLEEADLEFGEHRVDAAALVLLGTAGAVALASARELVTLVLGLETLSLVVAVLCGLGRGSRSLEAAFKFFVLSAANLGVLVFGIGLHAYATGALAPGAAALPGLQPIYQTAVVLIVLGLAFELAVVPLHFGALSAYSAMPSALAAFATTAGKAGAGIALIRLADRLDPTLSGPVLQAVGAGSILWAVFAGFAQSELRSLLAYSAVGHAGFLAVALGCGQQGRGAAAFYLIVYAGSSALTFAGLGNRGTATVPLDSLRQNPLPPARALAVILGLLSLAGMPPTPGLWAKIGVLVPAWHSGGPVLALVTALGGVFGALFYLRPVPDLLASLRQGRGGVPGAALVAMVLAGAAVAWLALMPHLAL